MLNALLRHLRAAYTYVYILLLLVYIYIHIYIHIYIYAVVGGCYANEHEVVIPMYMIILTKLCRVKMIQVVHVYMNILIPHTPLRCMYVYMYVCIYFSSLMGDESIHGHFSSDSTSEYIYIYIYIYIYVYVCMYIYIYT
jgi:hypothetical protein